MEQSQKNTTKASLAIRKSKWLEAVRLNEEKLKNDPESNLRAKRLVDNLNRNVARDLETN